MLLPPSGPVARVPNMTLSSLTQIEAAERSRLIAVVRYDIEVDPAPPPQHRQR